MNSALTIALVVYVFAKLIVLYGEYPEFDDFPDTGLILSGVLLVVLGIALNVWRKNYDTLNYLLLISALQLLAVKSGTYDSFLQLAVLGIAFVALGWWGRAFKDTTTKIIAGLLGLSFVILIPESM